MSCTQGIVRQVLDGKVEILIKRTSACSNCHIRSACTAQDQKDSVIVASDFPADLKVGDAVEIHMPTNQGLWATFWAFILPVLLLVLGITVATVFYFTEQTIALASGGGLIIYYFVLYVCRNLFDKYFSFHVTRKE